MIALSTRPVLRAFIVWGALQVLLTLTVLGAFMLPGAISVIVNIAIAAMKSTLVILYFMHLRHSSGIIRGVAMAGILCLSLFFILSGVDYVTRVITPSGWQQGIPSLSATP